MTSASFPDTNESTFSATIDEPLNRVVVHPIARFLLPQATALDVAPNAISIAGVGFGLLAALAYFRFDDWRFALAGFLAMLGWHVCDGLDGMVARATGRISAFGRFLDGFCDYSVFILVYVSLTLASAPKAGLAAWILAAIAGAAHAAQSAYYEARRETYLRRLRGELPPERHAVGGGWLERGYNRLQARMTNADAVLEARFRTESQLRQRYVIALRPLMKASTLLGQTSRTIVILLACLAGSPLYFWLWELLVLMPCALLIERRRRQIESSL